MSIKDDLIQDAQKFVHQLVEGDFTGASRRFDQDLLQALPEAKVKETWQQVISQVGTFQVISNIQAVESQDYVVVTATCQFEKMALDMRVTYNQGGQIAGLNFQPAVTPYHPPSYVNPAAFHEVEVTVGSGEWALPGTLSLPNSSDRKVPGVVLVHGSGPQDRDEMIGPNRPFRDLAWGLASQGIAVLRYEKRTKIHSSKYTPELIARITSKEEVIDDALSAVQLLRQRAEIDPGQVYLLGHSLGATLAPRIGQQDPKLAGLIIMAAIARPLEDVILDQYTHIYNLSGSMSDSQKAELEQLKLKVARAKDPNLSDHVPATDLPLGIYPAYWLDLRGYRPPEVAKTLPMRIFVLQGGRDYQTSAAEDFPFWQDALAGKGSATLKLYPKLYHLFIAGEGPSTPQEYFVEGHVSEEVIQDVARWIKSS